MSFFNNVYTTSVERLDKKFIVESTKNPNKDEIIVYTLSQYFDSWTELCKLNELFKKNSNIDNYKKLILIEIIFVRNVIFLHLLKKYGNMF